MPAPLLIPLYILLASGATAGAVTTGMALSESFEGKILSKLKQVFGNVFPGDIGFSDGQAMEAIGKYRWHIFNKTFKKNFTTLKYARDTILKEMNLPQSDSNGLLQLLIALNRRIVPEDGEIFTYLSTSPTTMERNLQTAGKRIDTAITFAAKQGEKVTKVLPWYLHPTKMLLMGGGVFVAYQVWQLYRAGKIFKKGIRPIKSNPVNSQADRLFEAFHGIQSRNNKKVSLPFGASSEIVELGTAPIVAYTSDKWGGEMTDYLHEFTTPPNVYASEDGGTLIFDGDFKITHKGIEG